MLAQSLIKNVAFVTYQVPVSHVYLCNFDVLRCTSYQWHRGLAMLAEQPIQKVSCNDGMHERIGVQQSMGAQCHAAQAYISAKATSLLLGQVL